MTEPDFVYATRASYDTVAVDYVTWFGGELAARPLDRALLAGFAELVRAAGAAPIADAVTSAASDCSLRGALAGLAG
jgi:hypothetical protein